LAESATFEELLAMFPPEIADNPMRDRVNLNFGDYETLPDPDHLLEGTGKGIRHVKIRSAADLRRPGVKALLQAAAKRVTPPS
jgi:hypothetical protein